MTTYTNIPQDITKLKDEKMDKSNNLSDLADRAAAWLNVRPIGSTPLAGDPVEDYDAVTKRWVENKINTGTVGPTMNGVMNYGVGDFHLRDSRAYIQPYEVVSDGQLLNRADWPELWAYAQMVGAIEDSVWLADKFQRGKYSKGDGSTTFRVPDKNGVQAGSIRALYGRGDGGNSGANGQLFESAAPNIIGTVPSYSSTNYAQVFGSAAAGAFFVNNGIFPGGDGDAIPSTGNIALAGRYNTLNFDASHSSPIYGASTDEILTRNFVGVWVIRASGGFVAANTSWSVINGDATRPADGTVVEGGDIISLYKVNGANEAEASFRVRADIGGNYYARISVKNNTTKRSANLDLSDDGTLITPHINSMGGIDSKGGVLLHNVPYPALAFRPSRYTSPDTQLGAFTKFEVSGQDGEVAYVSLSRHYGTGGIEGAIYVMFPNTGGTLALQGTSGINYKKNIVDADANEAMDRITGQRLVNFVYKDDEQERVRFGIIAEEAELIAPQYIKHHKVPYEDIIDEDGNKIGEKTRDRPSVDVNPIVMDLMGCVQALNKRIEVMEAEIAKLKTSK
ncbi:tail fiber domain-containing protein [Escherichia coli]